MFVCESLNFELDFKYWVFFSGVGLLRLFWNGLDDEFGDLEDFVG